MKTKTVPQILRLRNYNKDYTDVVDGARYMCITAAKTVLVEWKEDARLAPSRLV